MGKATASVRFGKARHKAAAGYSIVEAGIVLAVVGLLLSSSLVPLGARLRAEKVGDARDQLEEINSAILGYAATHRTIGAVAILDNVPSRRHASIPAGRPYLPCPDVTGDGLEDRHALPELPNPNPSPTTRVTVSFLRNNEIRNQALERLSFGTSVSDSVASELTFQGDRSVWSMTNVNFRIAAPDFAPITVTMSSDSALNQLTTASSTSVDPGFGTCVSDKGSLPWSTLGTDAHDPWGNRFTYRVDPIFAHQVLGIGPETRADMYDPRLPLQEVTLTLIAGGVPTTKTFASFRRRSTVYVQSVTPSQTFLIDELPGFVCTDTYTFLISSGCSISPIILTIAGHTLNDVATTQVTLFDVLEGVTVARRFIKNDIINGMSFIVLSHGRNGYGAIPHFQSQNINIGTGFTCNRPVTSAIPQFWDLEAPEIENLDTPAGLCGGTPIPQANGGFPHNHSFTTLVEHITTDSTFDDLITHQSGEQLINSLRDLGVKMDEAWLPPGICNDC